MGLALVHFQKYWLLREFRRSFCEKVFKSKSTLKAHIEYVHEGKKKDKCDICNKEFPGKNALNEHIAAVHDGKKLKLCPISYSGQLKRHIETVHEGKRQCACHICGHISKDKKQLTLHISAMHEKKKPFECQLCNQRYVTRGQSVRYQQEKHENVTRNSKEMVL